LGFGLTRGGEQPGKHGDAVTRSQRVVVTRKLAWYNATRAASNSLPAGRRRFHVFSFDGLQLSFSKPLQAGICESRLHAFAERRIPQLATRELSLSSFPRLQHLASSCRNASPCEEAPRSENESASLSLTNEARSSPFGARSVRDSIAQLLACQARSSVRRKKFA
jgi:hypothetical protein